MKKANLFEATVRMSGIEKRTFILAEGVEDRVDLVTGLIRCTRVHSDG